MQMKKGQPVQIRWILFLFGIFGNLMVGGQSWAFNQPPMNHSITTFLDGGAPQGFYYMNYSILTKGKTPMDQDGNEVPGGAKVNALVSSHQFYYISTAKFLGGNLALDVILSLSAVTSKGQLPVPPPAPPGNFFPVTSNTAGMADTIIGPALVWNGGTLLGGPFFQRFELQTTFPTGKYEKDNTINPGSNLTTFNPYYSAVWMFGPKWETSWRFYYAIHSTNKDDVRGPVKPGQAAHLNYAVSREVLPKWRLGVAGYYLQQLTEDKINGVKVDNSKERVISAGPGFVYMGQGLTAMFSYPLEFSVENRFKGSRATLQLIHKF
jgi:hypothetical protein